METRIEELQSRPVLGIRKQIAASEIHDTLQALIPKLMEQVGGLAQGPMISRWHEWDESGGTVEVAFPVAPDAQSDAEGVEKCSLPAGRAVVYEHIGSYEGLPETWRKLMALVSEQGHTVSGPPWEEYVSDCSVVPEAELLTRIVIPV